MIERILQLIDEKKISAYRFTTDCGLSNGSVSEWKTGRSKPKVENLIKIADYFDVSLDYLCGRTDDPK